MNRRGFLRLFGGAGAVATVAPTYFFAPVGGWHPSRFVSYNVFLTSGLPPQELLRTYYDKRFVENLKAQTPMMMMGGLRALPEASNRIVTFMPTSQHVDMSPRVRL